MCTTKVPKEGTGSPRTGVPGDCKDRTTTVLRSKPRSYARAVSALNCQVVSLEHP